MRYLVLFLYVLFASFTLTFSANAADPVAVFWANDFGTRLTRIKKPEDIMKQMNFAGTNASIVQSEIAGKKIVVPAFKYKVYVTQIFMIDANKKRTIIDFEHYKNKRLLLNGKSISLRPTKTYNDYVAEVDKILGQQSNKKASLMDVMINSAYAQSEGGIGSFLGSFFSAASDTRHLELYQADKLERKKDKDQIAEALIEAYALEAERAKTASARGQDSTYTSMMFWCEGNVMSRATEVTVKNNNTFVKNDGRNIESIPGGGYKFYYGSKMSAEAAERAKVISCTSNVDDNGLVMDVVGRNPNFCPAKDLNIFNDPGYLGAYPKIARLCCQHQGCYEKVMAERDKIIGVSTQEMEARKRRMEEIKMSPEVQQESGVE